jgi:SSS family solute:Na+ symporter
MIIHLLPSGLTGVMAAALLAALMSTVSGALNSIATLFSYDLYLRWYPKTSDRTLVFIGRIVTFVAMILAILWSPLISHFESIFQGIVAIICYIAPPVTTVFIWGVFWPRASARGSIITLITGSFLGLLVFLLDWYKDMTGWHVPPMMVTFYLFVLCSAILVLSSYLRPQKHTAESEKLVWKNPLQALQSPGWPGLANYKFLAILLFVTMVVLYGVFG